jgi:hypothetical protein
LERLEAGVLQLSDGTHLMLDETSMAQGELAEKGTCVCVSCVCVRSAWNAKLLAGVRNLLALQQVIQNQVRSA